MNDVGPNQNLNKWLAGLICVVAMLPLYFGFHSLTFLPAADWGWSAVPLGMGGVLLLAAFLAWRRPPMNAARITFTEGGFRLETRQVFRGDKVFDLRWSTISQITSTNGGLYGGRWIRVHYGSGAQYAMFSPSWTNSDTIRIIERLEASAQVAGYSFENEVGFWKGLVRDRWVVQINP